MLKTLTISNFVIIENLQLNFSDKLTIITGETGAGKSLIIDALCFVGNLISKSNNLLRKDSDKGFVAVEFAVSEDSPVKEILQELEIEFQPNLILRRTLNADNKTKGFINDIPVTLATLKRVGQELIEISAQFEAMKLFKPKFYLNYIDQYANLGELLTRVRTQYQLLRILQIELKEALEAQERQAQEQDYLRFVLNELNELNPKLNEETELQHQRNILSKQAKMQQFLAETNSKLEDYDGIIPQLLSLQKTIIRNQGNFENLELSKCSDYIDAALEQLNQASILLNNPAEGDYSSLEEIESRLLNLRAAARKYRITVDELVNYKEQIIEKINNFATLDQDIVTFEQKIAKEHKEYFKLAELLSKERLEAADMLSVSLNEELKQLNMLQVKVRIEHYPLVEPSSDGMDQFDFMIRTNEVSEFGKVADIASGGELSRFILALKVIMANQDQSQLLIFDEIDTGVSGATASKIGKKLKELSHHHQILLITHQPQIAAFSNQHLLVSKAKEGRVTVGYLNHEQHIQEVARLISGEKISNEAVNAAERLIEEGKDMIILGS